MADFPIRDLPQEPLINSKLAEVLSTLIQVSMELLGHPDFIFALNEDMNRVGGKVDFKGKLDGSLKMLMEGKVQTLQLPISRNPHALLISYF